MGRGCTCHIQGPADWVTPIGIIMTNLKITGYFPTKDWTRIFWCINWKIGSEHKNINRKKSVFKGSEGSNPDMKLKWMYKKADSVMSGV